VSQTLLKTKQDIRLHVRIPGDGPDNPGYLIISGIIDGNDPACRIFIAKIVACRFLCYNGMVQGQKAGIGLPCFQRK